MTYTRGTHLLFVDDDSSLLSGLRRSLRNYRDRWQMTFTGSGSDALSLLERGGVDVVVSDVRMPGMDGVELMSEVRARHPSIVRLMLSGQAEQEKLLQLVGLAHQYFAKPCNAKDLYQAVSWIRQQQSKVSCPETIAALTSLEFVPSDPNIFQELASLVQYQHGSLKPVIEVIEKDPGLSLKVLQLVHSNFFGKPQRSWSVEAACRTLGRELLGVLFRESIAFGIAGDPQPTFEQQSIEIERLRNAIAIQIARNSDTHPAAADQTSLHYDAAAYLLALWGVSTCPEQAVAMPGDLPSRSASLGQTIHWKAGTEPTS